MCQAPTGEPHEAPSVDRGGRASAGRGAGRQPARGGARDPDRPRRRERFGAVAGFPAGSGGAGCDAPAPLGPRGVPPDAIGGRPHPGAFPQRQRPARGAGRGPQRRRRRLPDQTLPPPRVAAAGAEHVSPARVGPGRGDPGGARVRRAPGGLPHLERHAGRWPGGALGRARDRYPQAPLRAGRGGGEPRRDPRPGMGRGRLPQQPYRGQLHRAATPAL